MSKKQQATPSPALVHLVECANANDALMDGTTAPVKRIIAAHKIVYAIWQDSDRIHGVDCMVIKGGDKLRRIAASGVPIETTVTAIKTRDIDQAVAAAQVFGDKAAKAEAAEMMIAAVQTEAAELGAHTFH